jgi:hypothetical protein
MTLFWEDFELDMLVGVHNMVWWHLGELDGSFADNVQWPVQLGHHIVFA